MKIILLIITTALPAFAQTTNIVRTTNFIPVVSEIRTVTIYVTNTAPVVVPPPVTNPPPVAATNQGLRIEFEIAPVAGKNPSGLAVSTGQVTVEGDWQFGPYGALQFRFKSAHHGLDQGARIVTYALPAPDGAWHRIEASYDLQFVTIKRDGVVVVRDWLDSQTTEIPVK